MASFEPFAVDITIPCEAGGSVMFHVRAQNADEFATRIRAAMTRVPVLQGIPELRAHTINELVHAEEDRPIIAASHAAAQRSTARAAAAVAAAPAPIRTAVPAGPDPMPVCPESGRSSWSKHYGGLFCPETHGDGRCKWQHRCGASCTHAAKAA